MQTLKKLLMSVKMVKMRLEIIIGLRRTDLDELPDTTEADPATEADLKN